MSFGLTNVPATFQHLMETYLGDLHLRWCIIYLDDIILFSKTPGKHIQRQRGAFEKLTAAGLKLKPSKYHFFCTQISYLGHIALKDIIETDTKKIETIVNWSTPKTMTDIRSFLWFVNQHRQFIHCHAHITGSPNILTSDDNAAMKRQSVEWNSDCNEAFKQLKDLCSKTPILAYANYSKSFKLHTDRYGLGLGLCFTRYKMAQTMS